MLSPSVSAHMEKTDSTRRLVRFGVFELDLRAGELRKNGLKIKLREQPFQILAMLLERPGEIVTREELRQKLWSNNTFVDFDNSVNKAINKIREAVGDSADNPRFVETMARRGYRFIAPVEETSRELASGKSAAARMGNVDPSFVKALASLGYTGLSMGEVIRARNHGVNPEFIQELRREGYDSVSLDELIRLRNHGVTAEFIQRMKSQGFPRLSIEQLVKLRNAGF